MKFNLTFKTPDVIDPYMDTHCEEHQDYDANCDACIRREEQDCEKISQIQKVANKFIQYGETITIQFDTETGTATVLPVK